MKESNKIVLLDHGNELKVWISKEEWDLCQKFEKEQQRKLYKFMFGERLWNNDQLDKNNIVIFLTQKQIL